MTTPASKGRRPSAAAARRRRQEALDARAAGPAPLPAELGDTLAAYRPQQGGFTDEVWREIRPVLHAVMAHAAHTTAHTFKLYCGHVAALALWAHGTDRPLALEELMTYPVIDEYTRVGAPELSDSSRANRRARLRTLARLANPGPDAPDKPAPLPYAAIRPPYTAVEVAAIERIARTQPTPRLRRQVGIAVGLGLGAGLDSADLRHFRRAAITDNAEAGIAVEVPEPRPRQVVVRRRYEDLVRDGLAGLRSNDLVLGREADRHNVANRVYEDAVVLGHGIDLQQSRLRSTWLAALMTAPVPLQVILTAAGLRSARSLTDLLPHLPADTDDSDDLRWVLP